MKLLGNTVLIVPLDDADIQVSAGGLFLVNHHKHSTLKYRVLAVGPGQWRRRKGKLKPCFDKPEVEVGDCVITRAQLDDSVVKHTLDDGNGRLIIHGDGVLLKWRE